MFDTGTKKHGAFVADIFHKCIYNQRIPFRHIDLAFQIADIVLHAVESHLCQINVCMNTDAAYRYQFPDLNRCLNIQTVRGILENVKNILIVGAFRRCSQTECKCRGKYRRTF